MNNKRSRGPGYINVLNSGHGIGYSSSGHPVTIKALKEKNLILLEVFLQLLGVKQMEKN